MKATSLVRYYAIRCGLLTGLVNKLRFRPNEVAVNRHEPHLSGRDAYRVRRKAPGRRVGGLGLSVERSTLKA